MQQDDDNRLLIELRLTDNDKWFLDTFIKSEASDRVLYADGFFHDAHQISHAGLIYKNGRMSHFVNGVLELSGSVDYRKVRTGQTSLGVRLNKVSWFKGYISKVKITPCALSPEELKTSDIFRLIF
jgi:hypothetical protein